MIKDQCQRSQLEKWTYNGSMRILLTTLALALSGLAAFITIWIVVPAPHFRLWQLAVGASEWSLWVGLTGVVGVVLGVLVRLQGARIGGSLAIALGLLTVTCALVPPLLAWRVAQANEVRLSLRQYIFGLEVPAVVPQEVVFATVDNQPLALDVYRDPAATDIRPAVIVVHGGSWNGGTKSDFPRWNAWLVQQGYTVFDIEYRLAPQPNWQTATGDVKCAIGWVKRNASAYNVDPQRITLLGRSAGGHLALLAAYTPDEPNLPPSCDAPDTTVRSVVSFYGPTDLVWGYNNPARPDIINGPGTLRSFLGGDPRTALDAFQTASPINHVGPNTPPTLLLHGGRDQLVGQRHTEFLSQELAALGIPHRSVLIPYGQHGFDYNFNGWSSQVVQPVLQQFLQETIPPGPK